MLVNEEQYVPYLRLHTSVPLCSGRTQSDSWDRLLRLDARERGAKLQNVDVML